MIPFDDQHQAHELLDSIITNDEISNFISQCLNSPGTNTALYSIFASHDIMRNALISQNKYNAEQRVESWHRSLLTAFALGVTIARSFTKLENTWWEEEENEGTV